MQYIHIDIRIYIYIYTRFTRFYFLEVLSALRTAPQDISGSPFSPELDVNEILPEVTREQHKSLKSVRRSGRCARCTAQYPPSFSHGKPVGMALSHGCT